ncbi:MAG TPA: hypothetical protein VN081_06165 [Dongiaceae bacterium]|nr:hypothetical protein [Dongiaceae bacterium]
MEALTRKQRRSGFTTLIFLLLAVALAIVPLVGMSGGNATASNTPKPTPSATPSGTPTATCDPAYKQVSVGHSGGKVDDGFATFGGDLIKQGSLSVAQVKLLVEYAGHRADDLAKWAYPAGLITDPNKWQSLVSNGCLSQEGQKLLDQWEGVLVSTNTKLAVSDAPSDGYNSGVSDSGVYGVDGLQGVVGNRKAIQITLPNGTTYWIMIRCGNPVFKGKPHLPTVPTNNPRCQWNATLPPESPECLKPKGDSINNTWTPLGLDPQTNGTVSQEQKASGQTSGNVTDHTVPSNTTSGSTTPDMGSHNGTTSSTGSTAPGASPGGDSQSTGTPTSAPQDPTGSSNTGGTSGQTCVPTPAVPTCP